MLQLHVQLARNTFFGQFKVNFSSYSQNRKETGVSRGRNTEISAVLFTAGEQRGVEMQIILQETLSTAV